MPTIRAWMSRWICIAVAYSMLVPGCVSSQRVFPLSPAPEAIRPATVKITDYSQAITAISTILTGNLGLPAPEGTATLYSNSMTLEAALFDEFQKDAELAERQLDPKAREKFRAGRTERLALEARQLATTADAVAMHRRIFINELLFVRYAWYERTRIIAHEMAHVVERGLVNGRPFSPGRWIQEGFADWVAFKVQDVLGYETFGKSRQDRITAIAKAKAFQTFPSLTQLNSGDDWLTWVRTLGREATYAQAFLAVDFLIEHKGLPALIDYFRLFNKLNNRERNFTTASGEAMKTFEAKFDTYLTSLLGK